MNTNQGDGLLLINAATNAAISVVFIAHAAPHRALVRCNRYVSFGCGSRICSNTDIAKNSLDLKSSFLRHNVTCAFSACSISSISNIYG